MVEKRVKYIITDKTLLNIARIERLISLIDQAEIFITIRNKIKNESLFDDLFALNSFLKLGLTLGDVKKVAIGKSIDKEEGKILSNVKQVHDFIRNNFQQNRYTFNFHFIQHIVKLLQSNILEFWDIGKIRTGGEILYEKFELENQSYYRADTTHFLAENILWVEENQEIHPIIKACVFMTFINRFSPFVGLNYLSSLVFFRLILQKYGYDSIYQIPLFKLFLIKNNEFTKLANKATEQGSEITEFIELVSDCLYELLHQYRTSLIKFDYFDIRSNYEKVNLNERQLRLLKLLQHKVFIRRHEYAKLFKVSAMTAYRDLNFLVGKKILKISGNGRATSYSLSTR